MHDPYDKGIDIGTNLGGGADTLGAAQVGKTCKHSDFYISDSSGPITSTAFKATG